MKKWGLILLNFCLLFGLVFAAGCEKKVGCNLTDDYINASMILMGTLDNNRFGSDVCMIWNNCAYVKDIIAGSGISISQVGMDYTITATNGAGVGVDTNVWTEGFAFDQNVDIAATPTFSGFITTSHISTTGIGAHNIGTSDNEFADIWTENIKFAPGNNYGIRFWGSADYTVYMSDADPDLGGVTGYSMTFKMADLDGQGFRWCNQNECGMSLESYTGQWDLTLDGIINSNWTDQNLQQLASPTFAGLTSSDTVSGTQLISTIATGTAPFTVASTTKVTNLNADLLEGQHASASAGNSTIVQRTASGYIYANYFNTTAATTATNPSHYFVMTGTDGFIRKSTPANMVTQLAADGLMPKSGGTFTGDIDPDAERSIDIGDTTHHINDIWTENILFYPLDGAGIRFWDSASYAIYMSDADPDLGGVTSFSLTMKMSDTDGRGFRWMNQNETGMSLESFTGSWNLQVRDKVISGGNMEVGGYLQIGRVANNNLPVCSATYSGQMIIESQKDPPAPAPDRLYICLETPGQTWIWVLIVDSMPI